MNGSKFLILDSTVTASITHNVQSRFCAVLGWGLLPSNKPKLHVSTQALKWTSLAAGGKVLGAQGQPKQPTSVLSLGSPATLAGTAHQNLTGLLIFAARGPLGPGQNPLLTAACYLSPHHLSLPPANSMCATFPYQNPFQVVKWRGLEPACF